MNPQTQFKQIDRLQDAFQAFNRLSQNLTDSYQDLESRVACLTQELIVARHARLKTLSEKERLANRLQTLLDALPAGVVVVDEEGKISEHNKAADTLIHDDLVGRRWQDIAESFLRPGSENPHEKISNSGKVLSLSSNSLGEGQGQIILLTEVTEIRVLQGLVEQQKRLSALGKTVASIAHQIRTPLATAMLYASHLRKENLDRNQRQNFSKKLYERLQFLERQVNDMLVFAKDGQLVTEQVSVKALVNTLTDVVDSFVVNTSVKFSVENQASIDRIEANDKALSGALTNLLTNAFEAIQSGGSVKLEISDDGGDFIQFVVSDDGPGIPQNIRENIFEPFFTTRSNGTGLGLSVVDRVAKAHDGKVWCASSPTGHSQFYLKIPIIRQTKLLPSGLSLRDGIEGVN